MTEQEAQRILNEHRSMFPKFVRGKYRYTVRPNGDVDVERAVGKSGMRWAYDRVVKAANVDAAFWIEREVRERSREFRG